jgi:hypothetical protein
MGKSESKAKNKIRNENNTLIVNRSSLNVVNEQINSNTSNVAVDNAKTCSSATNLSNEISFRGADIGGNLNIGASDDPNKDCSVELKQTAAVSFKCAQASSVRNDMATEMIKTMMNQMENSVSEDIMTQLDNKAAATTKTEGGLGSSSSSSDNEVTNINNYQSVTETSKNIENIVKSSVESNFSVKDAQDCMNVVNMKQGFDASGARVAGDVNMCNFKATQVASIMGECIQKSDTGNKVMETVTTAMGVKIKEDVKKSSTMKAKTVTEATAETKGMELPDISLFGGMGGMSMSLAPCVLICCCVCILICMLSLGGGTASAGMQGGMTSDAASSWDLSTYSSNK